MYVILVAPQFYPLFPFCYAKIAEILATHDQLFWPRLYAAKFQKSTSLFEGLCRSSTETKSTTLQTSWIWLVFDWLMCDMSFLLWNQRDKSQPTLHPLSLSLPLLSFPGWVYEPWRGCYRCKLVIWSHGHYKQEQLRVARSLVRRFSEAKVVFDKYKTDL